MPPASRTACTAARDRRSDCRPEPLRFRQPFRPPSRLGRRTPPLPAPFPSRNEGEVHPLECLVLASAATLSGVNDTGADSVGTKKRRAPKGPSQIDLSALTRRTGAYGVEA